MKRFKTEKTACLICGEAAGQIEATGLDYIYGGSIQLSEALRCSGCGHIYLNPRPTTDSVSILYPANYASFSGKFTNKNGLIGELKQRVMLKRVHKYLADLPPGAKFLDLGCGDGQLLEAVKRRFPAIEVHGLDWQFSPDLSSHLKSLGIHLHESLLENADLTGNKFDLITMNQLIEHLWQPRECLQTIQKALAPDGLLILTTPNADGYDRKLFRSGLWGGYYFPRHLNIFDSGNLKRLIAECGFETISREDLVAPVVWCYSFKALMVVRFPAHTWLHRMCDTHNIPLLAMATTVDLAAKLFGAATSNQMLVARLVPSAADAPPEFAPT